MSKEEIHRMIVSQAGADHVPPADLEARVLAALDRGAAAPAPVAPAARRSRTPYLIGGALALAASVTAVVALSGGDEPATTTAVKAPPATATKIVRASAPSQAPDAGLAIAAPGATAFRRLAEHEPIPAGSRLRTDASTRAWIAIAGGTLSIDHATELVLGDRVRLVAGRIAVEDVHGSFETAHATARPLGTRFTLTATPDATTLHVTRGAVALAAGSSRVDVRAGEEATAAKGQIELAPVPATALDTWWVEETGAAADAGSSGIGALRAFRPGESRDKDWALTLARHRVKVRIVGPIARTEIEETFRNDTARQLEGVYQFPLPADARIEALALDVPGKPGQFEHGAFVERDRAARIWQGAIDKARPRPRPRPPAEIIWVPGRWKDPALLEWERGGRFELRVFPIPASGERTIRIAYTQVLAPRGAWRRYVYPLPHSADGSTAAEAFDLDLRVAGARAGDVRLAGYDGTFRDDDGDAALTLEKRGFVPSGDLVVEHRPPGAAEVRAWTFAGGAAVAPDEALVKRSQKKDLGIDDDAVAAQRAIAGDVRPAVVLALRPELPRWSEARPRDLVIVVDASQSMVGERRTRAIELASTLVGELDPRDRVAVLSCDVECREQGQGLATASAQTAAAVRAWLEAETPAGASDLAAALRAGLARVGADPERDRWVVYLGDGFATTGFRRPADVEALVADAASGARVTTVAIGGDADTTLLAAAARGGGGSHVAWLPGQRVAAAALAVLDATRGATLRDPVLELPAGLADIAPSRLPTIRAGEEVLVGARFTGDVKGEIVLRGTVAGQRFEQRYPIELTASTAPGNAFVPRVWAALAIEELERGGRGEDRARIVGLSKGYGVLSRHTSLLVLESEAMFRAFAVDRTAPQVTWTGDEELDEVVATGTVAYKDNDAPMAAAPAKRSAEKKKSDTSFDLAGKGGAVALADGDGGGGGAWEARGRAARGPGMWMRRVWYRVGAVSDYDGVSSSIRDAIARAEDALAASPDSREKHRALVQALAYAGEIERAREIATRWLERDRLDPQALVYLADLLGREGRRDEAVRTLSGIVDLSPDDVKLHERLAAALDRAGATERACSHRIALAAIRPDDTKAAAAAMRCLRTLGRDRDASRIASALPDDAARVKAERAATAAPVPERASGELTVRAQWTGGADLDLSIVTPQGSRVSWLGGRAGVSATDAGAVGLERLALRRASKGRYLVEIARTAPGDRTPVRGTVEVTVLGVTRRLPFTLDGDRAVLGRVTVSMESRLEPVR